MAGFCFGREIQNAPPFRKERTRKDGAFDLLRWGCGWRWRRGIGGYFGSDRIDLHRREDCFQAAEDFVAVDVLGDAVLAGDGGHVQGELVAGSILEDMEVLRVALASAFTGDGFGGAEFEVAEH